MSTRVTDALMYGKGQEAIARSREKMVKNQEQAVTGKRINKPSDDPVGSMRAIGLKNSGDRADQVSNNLESASAILNLTDNALGELTEVLSRAKELAIQMSSSSNDTESARMAVANEVEQLTMRAVQIGNTRMGDRYVFGGFQTDRPPFDVQGNYFGDGGSMEIEVDRGQRLATNVPGVLPFYGMQSLPEDAQRVREQQSRDSEPTLITPPPMRAPASMETKPTEAEKAGAVATAPMPPSQEGVNIFNALKGFSQGLRDGDIKASQAAVANLDDSFKQVLASRAMVGARQNLLMSSQESLGLAHTTNAELLSNTQDADSLKVLSDLTKNEHALQATLETSKRLISPSLLDFLK